MLAALLAAMPALAQTAPLQTAAPEPVIPPLPPLSTAAALEAALKNVPPLILGGNVQPTLAGGSMMPLACPAAGARVEQKGGPTFEYRGPSPSEPELCLMTVGERSIEAWYGIWPTHWAGAEFAHRALQRLLRSRTGDVVGFDTIDGPDKHFHDLLRLDGIEEITLRDTTYTAVKIAHYREGFDGNIYRSLRTMWKDIPTGIILYATYQHIAGAPDLDEPMVPTAIVPTAPVPTAPVSTAPVSTAPVSTVPVPAAPIPAATP